MIQIKYSVFLWMCLSVLVGCSSTSTVMPCEDDPRCLVYGITSDILILDPHVSDSTEAGIVFRQIYDTLVYRHPTSGEIVPGLAESWEISDDGLLYTFHLRNDVTFQDGTSFNAQAVADNIDRIFDADINSEKARLLLGSFSRYEVVDEFTIRIYLFEPYVPLLDGLAQPFLAIASPQSLSENTNLRYQFHQIGTGPFKLDNYLPGERIELSRNTDYRWAPSVYNPLVDGEINRILFKIISDSTVRTETLLNGEVDIVGDMLPADASILVNNSSIQLVPIDIPGQSVQFYMNTTQAPTDNPIVRQSLLFATNRAAIVDEVYLNFSPIAWAPLSQQTEFAHTGYINQLSFDALNAADLLTSVGYQDTDGDGFLDLNGEKLELVMIVPPWGQLPQVAAFLREQWRSIGIDLIIEPVPGLNSLNNRIFAGNYNLVTFDNYGFDPAILNTTFSSTSTDNVTHFVNEQLDEFLSQAVQERDSLARRSQYYEIQSIVMGNALVIPIRDYVNINGVQSYVMNLRFDAYGWYPLLYNVSLEQ